MNDPQSSEAKKRSRLRWITLGESIAIAALIVSAIGVWLSWKGDGADKGTLTTIVERRPVIALALRGAVERDGRIMKMAPIEESHALQSLVVILPDARPIRLEGDGPLNAGDVQSRLGTNAAEGKGVHRVRAKIFAKYIEAGADKAVTGSYIIS